MTSRKSPTLAEFVARFLASQEISYAFGIPGGENLVLLEALRQQNIEFFLMHHEASAGFAAEVTGQITGKPGICIATVGPGAVNLVAGAASATLERSPALVITAEIDHHQDSRVSHMNIPLKALFEPVTKESLQLNPAQAWPQLRHAWQVATEAPPGAVHLALSPENAGTPIRSEHHQTPKPSRPPDIAAYFEDFLPTLQNTQKIMILAGLGAEAANVRDQLVGLAENWNVPVAVTPKAKGVFPEDHSLFAGCYSAYGDQALRQALSDSELILGVGLDGVDFVDSVWAIRTPVINLDGGRGPDPVTRPLKSFPGDISDWLTQLRTSNYYDRSGKQRAQAIRQGILTALDPKMNIPPGRIGLLALIDALRACLPQDGVITLDVGIFKLVFLQAWKTYLPKTLFVANGLSAMGYAIPAAMASKLAMPDRPVVCIVGDGALHMYAGELASLRRLGKQVLVLVIVDHSLALIRLKQKRLGLPILGTEFGATDYQALATAFDLKYALVEDQRSATQAFQSSLASQQPILVEARIDLKEYDHFL